MSNINFRKTKRGYCAEFQRNDGFGYEIRYYRRSDVENAIGKVEPDAWYIDGEITNAEAAINSNLVTPYMIVK